MSREVTKFPGARLVEVTLSPYNRETTAWVVVRTPRALTPPQVARLNDVVNAATGAVVSLHVRSVITTETAREGYVYGPQPLLTEDPIEP